MKGMHVLFSYFLHLYLIGVWFGEDQRKTPRKSMLKKIDYVLKLFNYSTLNNWEGSYMCSQLRINKHRLSNMSFIDASS